MSEIVWKFTTLMDKFAIIYIRHFLFIKPHDIYNDLAGLKRQFHLLFMGEYGQFESAIHHILCNWLVNMDHTGANVDTHSRETKDKVVFNELKILLLGKVHLFILFYVMIILFPKYVNYINNSLQWAFPETIWIILRKEKSFGVTVLE